VKNLHFLFRFLLGANLRKPFFGSSGGGGGGGGGTSPAGGAASGALSGAATGTAILPGVGTAIGAVVGGIGGYLGGKSAKKQAQKQNEAMKEYMEWQERERQKEVDRAFFGQEGAVKQRYADLFSTMNNEMDINDLKRIRDLQDPNVEAAGDYITGMFNRDLLDRELDYLEPVNQARTKAAFDQLQAVRDARDMSVSGILSKDAGKGFLGGSRFANQGLLSTFIPAQQRASALQSQAALDNAMATFDLQKGDIDRMGSNLSLPMQFGQQSVNYELMPYQTQLQGLGDFMNAARALRFSPGQSVSQPEYTAVPNPLAAGLQGIGGAMAANPNGTASLFNSVGGLFRGKEGGTPAGGARTGGLFTGGVTYDDGPSGSGFFGGGAPTGGSFLGN